MKVKVTRKGYAIFYTILLNMGNVFFTYVAISIFIGDYNIISKILIGGLITVFCVYCIIKSIYDFFAGMYTHEFVINNEGVGYIKKNQRYFLKWDEIRYIHLPRNISGKVSRIAMLCFNSGGYVSRIRNIVRYDKTFFGVQYRKEIIDEVKKYWEGPICP